MAALALEDMHNLAEPVDAEPSILGLAVVSRPEELHLRPLAELCMRLSPHTAPIRQTCRPYLSASAQRDAGSSPRWTRGRDSPVSCASQSACTFASPTPPMSC